MIVAPAIVIEELKLQIAALQEPCPYCKEKPVEKVCSRCKDHSCNDCLRYIATELEPGVFYCLDCQAEDMG